MPLETLQIVDTSPESYLSPSVVWKYFREEVVFDHRSYYSAIEFLTVVCLQQIHVSAVHSDITLRGNEGLRWMLWIGGGVTLLLAVIPLHWYGNQRRSAHFLTKLGSHLTVLISLTVAFIACQILTTISLVQFPCHGRTSCRVPDEIELQIMIIYWICVGPLALAIVALSYGPRRYKQREAEVLGDPQEDSPGLQDEQSWWQWLLFNVADGIDDDYPQEVGELRIRDEDEDVVAATEPAQDVEGVERSEGDGALRI